MIREALAWLAGAEVVAAFIFAVLVYVISRKSRHPIAIRSVIFLAVFIALPALLLYFVAWVYLQLASE